MARLNLKALKNVQSKVFTQSAVLGIAATITIILLDWGGDQGMLAGIERLLFDERAKWNQNFKPEPTDQLMHIDIDDPSLQHIGSWPWPREKIARMLDEINHAGAKTVAFDIIFAETQEERYRPVGNLTLVNDTSSIFEGQFQQLIDDQHFAKSIANFGKVILPASFDVKEPETEAESMARKVLKKNIFQSVEELQATLHNQHVKLPPAHAFRWMYHAARRRAMYDLINESIERQMAAEKASKKTSMPTNRVGAQEGETGAAQPNPPTIAEGGATSGSQEPPTSTEATPLAESPTKPVAPVIAKPKQIPLKRRVRDDVLPNIEKKFAQAHLADLFEKEYAKALSFYHLRAYSRPSLPEYQAMPMNGELATIPLLVLAQGAFGFVDHHLSDDDGKARKLALFEEYEGRLYPNLSVALACAALDIDINDIEIEEDVVIFPVPSGKRIEVPVFRHYVDKAKQTCGLFAYFPWFGTPNATDAWMSMYDRSGGDVDQAHLPMLKVWEIVELKDDKITHNTTGIRDALYSIFAIGDPDLLAALLENPIPLDDPQGYLDLLEKPEIASKLKEIPGWVDNIDKMTDEAFAKYLAKESDATLRILLSRMRAALIALPNLRDQLIHSQKELKRLRANLQQKLKDKAILVGWTAVGRMDDIPTSLHPSVPGVVAHGVMFNGIVTGEVWKKASPWTARLFTLFVGLIITLAVSKLTPARALATALTLGVLYVLFNCIVLFDMNNLVVGMAAPLLTIVVVWASGTMLRFIVERREKAFITRRFRSYVDPALVNFVMENPDRASFAGEVREMTVVFTDLQGFTSISEKLQEATVPLLNEYMERMVPLIREREGYVNKFLGDGIMFFYGAPKVTKTHAVDAVATAIRMQEAMDPFNEKLKADDLPSVIMRVGISTGSMVVGDAGSHDAADYTVLGDSVNFAARLESANKYIGTRMMISERTAELIGDQFLLRPLAKLQVVGKTQGMVAYEPLNFTAAATSEQRQLATLTTQMFDQYKAGDFDSCLETLIELDELAGGSKLTSLYREQCEQYLVTPPDDDFDGTIVLTSK